MTHCSLTLVLPLASYETIVPSSANILFKSPSINAQYFLHTRELRWYYHRHELFAVAYSGTGINVTAQKLATRSEDGDGEVLYADQRNGD